MEYQRSERPVRAGEGWSGYPSRESHTKSNRGTPNVPSLGAHLPRFLIDTKGEAARGPKHVPTVMWRVRWRRITWTNWSTRNYVRRDQALRLARKLHADGAEVELATFALDPVECVHYPRPQPDPYGLRRGDPPLRPQHQPAPSEVTP